TLMGIKKAKTKEVKTVAGSPSAPEMVMDQVYLPQRQKQTLILSGDANKVAHELVEKLKFEARVLWASWWYWNNVAASGTACRLKRSLQRKRLVRLQVSRCVPPCSAQRLTRWLRTPRHIRWIR